MAVLRLATLRVIWRTILSCARLIASYLALGLAAIPVAAGQSASSLDRLVAAYPDFLAAIAENVLVWKDGTRMPVHDGAGAKSPARLLEAPDIADMFYWPYPANAAALPPAYEADLGRIRYQPFFDKMYGDCAKGEVLLHLVEIVWLPGKAAQRLRVTRINGVAERLEAVSRELDRLPPAFDRYLHPAAGTYNCRPIAGTGRPSAHGSGIAIDIAVRHAHYWRWSKPGAAGRYVYRNSIPAEIVAIFEKHGFIWGGRWYHYDTMHFEYRPELLP